jgi:hypothetical protein
MSELEQKLLQAWADFGKAHARRDALIAQLEAEAQELQRIYALIAQLQAEQAIPPAPDPIVAE